VASERGPAGTDLRNPILRPERTRDRQIPQFFTRIPIDFSPAATMLGINSGHCGELLMSLDLHLSSRERAMLLGEIDRQAGWLRQFGVDDA
jgi:hypothetical protein